MDYDLDSTATDYNLRGQVTGNVSEHSFQFKYIISDMQLVAKGVSQGSGYMLFKYTGWGDAVKYIVVPAGSDEDFFIAQNTTPTNIYTDPADLPSSVAAYKDWVVNASFLTSSEAVTNTNQFNVGNDKAGTIYMDYD